MYRVPKKQFKLWLEDDSLTRLSDAANKFGRGSAQQVVEELIALYLPLWMTVNTAVNRAIDNQARIKAEGGQYNNGIDGKTLAPTSRKKLPLLEPRKKNKRAA